MTKKKILDKLLKDGLLDHRDYDTLNSWAKKLTPSQDKIKQVLKKNLNKSA